MEWGGGGVTCLHWFKHVTVYNYVYMTTEDIVFLPFSSKIGHTLCKIILPSGPSGSKRG